MADSDDVILYTFVPGYIRRTRAIKPGDKQFVVECAFSNGKGSITDGIFPPRDCPACHGTGWITLNGLREDYKRCGNCNGTGKEGDDIFGWKPDHICKGSGLVKVR